ncbi:MAG: BMP family ABC transporter substrate-binding protein [Bacilli bacterium]|nr:BMP family ABC transporter substrate-binding protein [Bacilli bacterium]
MKKYLAILLTLVSVFAFVGCAGRQADIALVTDVGTVTDKSFNQGAWEGVVQFAEELDISHRYYQPRDQTTDEYVRSIESAIKNGAEIVVCPGYFFENAIWLVQNDYPDVKFIILDGAPHNVKDFDTFETVDGSAANFDQSDNVLSIFYAEEQVGFLAAYAAVIDGMTDLGFMGGKAVPAVVRYGYGYIQGADYAAKELEITVDLRYTYLGTFGPSASVQSKAATWYTEGTEVIFAAAGGAGGSVFKAAEQEEGKSIGVDVDQKDESTTVIISAMKMLQKSVYDALTDWHANEFPAGEVLMYDASNDGVGLSDTYDRMTTFNATMYDTLFNAIADGTIVVDNESEEDILVFAEDYDNVNLTFED